MSNLEELNTVLEGRLVGGDAASAARVNLGRVVADSRQIEPGDVFWALVGPHHDGADFASEAFRRGAVAMVTHRPLDLPDQHWAVLVDDTYGALRQWAAWKRRRFTGTLVAVTGSVGKTTTRQMIDTVLRTRLRGSASPRNFNNHLGVPLSLTAVEAEHDYAVLELGASRRGEIAALGALCRPKVGVITHVGDAHLGGFGSRRGVAEAKAELLLALPEDGRAVLGDDPWLRSMARRCRAEVTWVGTGEGCSLRAADVTHAEGRLGFTLSGCRFSVPVWGRHHLTAVLAAVAVGRMTGFDLDEMADVLEDFQPVPMRCELSEVRGATIINDAYNSNPTAMRAALELLGEIDAAGRRIVVCGDMAELGDESRMLHWKLGKQCRTVGQAVLVVACGQFARQVVAGARAAGMPRSHAIPCETVEQALPYLGQVIQPGDVVLVKGSRMMAMERVVEALRQYPQRRTA